MTLELYAKLYAVEVFDHDAEVYETFLLPSKGFALMFIMAVEREAEDKDSVCKSSEFERFVSMDELANMEPIRKDIYGITFHMFLGENVA